MTTAGKMGPPLRNGSVPNPDPTDRTLEQLLREIATSREVVEAKSVGNREVFETRLGGMDLAIELLQKSTDKIPDRVRDEVENLRQLHDERFQSFSVQMGVRFDAIAVQFVERDKRTEQLSLADKTAIAAALQAQKEAAGATTEMVMAAITKMDMNFTKVIDQTQTLLSANTRNTDEKINDLKGRFDRGEGRSVGQSATQSTNLASNSFILSVVVGLIALAGLALAFARPVSAHQPGFWKVVCYDKIPTPALPTDDNVLVTPRRTTCGDLHPNQGASDDAKRWTREPANCNLKR